MRAYRTTKEVFGVERPVVVTYNESLFVAQSAHAAARDRQAAAPAERVAGPALHRWQTGQVRGGKPPTMAGTRKTSRRLPWPPGDMKELFEVDLAEARGCRC